MAFAILVPEQVSLTDIAPLTTAFSIEAQRSSNAAEEATLLLTGVTT